VLTTLAEKLALLERCGVATCIVERSEPALLSQGAEDFLASLVAHVRPSAFVEGPDFHFGRGRGGSIETLQQQAARWAFTVHMVPAVHCAELGTHPVVSSSSIRQALQDGRVDDANVMLGRPYRVVGITGSGAGRGAGLGFPTANLESIPHMLPQHAVYGAVAQLADGRLQLAAVNVGPQPTFEGETTHVEPHLLDFHEDLRGKRVGLHFLRRLREQARFASRDALIEQIRRDVEATRALAGDLEPLRRSEPIPL
jgi:riboflavin kinase/FMN adenylyltransferase